MRTCRDCGAVLLTLLMAACGVGPESSIRIIPTDNVEVYDPATDSWSPGVDLPAPKAFHRCTSVGDVIYVAGGIANGVGSTDFLRYDPGAGVWETLADFPGTSGLHEVAALGTDVYAFGWGGFVDVYDTTTDTWSVGPSLMVPRLAHRAASQGGVLYVFGGLNGETSVEALDPSVGAWQGRSPQPLSLGKITAESDGSSIYVIGQLGLLIYDPAADSWSGPTALPVTNLVAFDSVILGTEIFLIGWTPSRDGRRLYAYDTQGGVWSERRARRRAIIYLGLAESGGNLHAIGGGWRDRR